MHSIKSLHFPILGLARYYQVKGFTEFEVFYSSISGWHSSFRQVRRVCLFRQSTKYILVDLARFELATFAFWTQPLCQLAYRSIRLKACYYAKALDPMSFHGTTFLQSTSQLYAFKLRLYSYSRSHMTFCCFIALIRWICHRLYLSQSVLLLALTIVGTLLRIDALGHSLTMEASIPTALKLVQLAGLEPALLSIVCCLSWRNYPPSFRPRLLIFEVYAVSTIVAWCV